MLFRLASLVLLASAPIFAQDASRFFGEWKMDAARSESAHQDVPIGDANIGIRESGPGLSIETTHSGEGGTGAFHEILSFRLDGAESEGSGDGGVKVTGKMHWDAGRLVVETIRNVQDSTITTHYVYSVSADGQELTVDKTLTVQHGYQFRGSQTVGRGKDVFVRVRGAAGR